MLLADSIIALATITLAILFALNGVPPCTTAFNSAHFGVASEEAYFGSLTRRPGWHLCPIFWSSEGSVWPFVS
jgi:hypothetical protein